MNKKVGKILTAAAAGAAVGVAVKKLHEALDKIHITVEEIK